MSQIPFEDGGPGDAGGPASPRRPSNPNRTLVVVVVVLLVVAALGGAVLLGQQDDDAAGDQSDPTTTTTVPAPGEDPAFGAETPEAAVDAFLAAAEADDCTMLDNLAVRQTRGGGDFGALDGIRACEGHRGPTPAELVAGIERDGEAEIDGGIAIVEAVDDGFRFSFELRTHDDTDVGMDAYVGWKVHDIVFLGDGDDQPQSDRADPGTPEAVVEQYLVAVGTGDCVAITDISTSAAEVDGCNAMGEELREAYEDIAVTGVAMLSDDNDNANVSVEHPALPVAGVIEVGLLEDTGEWEVLSDQIDY